MKRNQYRQLEQLSCICEKYVGENICQISNAAILECDNKIYAFGGRRDDGLVLRSIVTFDKDNKSFACEYVDDLPLLEGAAAASTSHNSFIFGGASLGNEKQLWKWTPDSSKISKSFLEQIKFFGKGPSCRSNHTVVSYRNDLVIFGGFIDLYGSSNEVWILPTRTKPLTWKRGTSALRARHSHSAEVYNNEMYVFGGVDQQNLIVEFEKYNFITQQWSKAQVGYEYCPCSRYGHASCASEDYMFIYGGIDASNDFLSDLWLYSFKSTIWVFVTFGNGLTPGPCAFGKLHFWNLEDKRKLKDVFSNTAESVFSNSFVNEAFDSDSAAPFEHSSCFPTTGVSSFPKQIGKKDGSSQEFCSSSTAKQNHPASGTSRTSATFLLLFGGKFYHRGYNSHISVWKLVVNLPSKN